MLTRIVSGVIGAALMISVLLFGGVWGVAIVMGLAGAVAVFELLRAADLGWGERIPAMAVAAAAPLLYTWRPVALLLAAGAYWLYVLVICVARHAALPVERGALLWLLPTAAVTGFTAVAALRGEPEGLFYVFLTLVIPWLSDTGAYFTGVAFGKHKLCPVISPKKTVEGLVGGILFAMLAAAATGWLYGLWCGYPVRVNWWGLLLAAAVGTPLSVFGDLFASVVKRRFGVKDYGTIMPGHGGVMDRFDSVLPTAVWLWLLTRVISLITA